MRTAFIESLFKLAQSDDRIMLIVGDLGFGVVEPFRTAFPKQFLNAGVAEQNMTGLAVGMALSGKIVFTYSIANFPILRCLEQIRNDICYHNANVKVVSVGGGMAYGAVGVTHHATEDLAIMRALPSIKIIAPNDPVETRLATRTAALNAGPYYLRLGRSGEPTIHKTDSLLDIDKPILMREGRDLTLMTTGGLLYNVLQAADILAQKGLKSRVLSIPTIKPLDATAVIAAAMETKAIITVEEHTIYGGLGGAVAEILLESQARAFRFKRIGLDQGFSSVVGDQTYLRSIYGLDATGIAAAAERVLYDK
ncbi:MAG: transketolase C-terminal domain-containing protein [Candidatus Aminicenantales bacterium]